MESLYLDDATTVLLEPVHPRENGRIIRMPMHYFVEIISSFRLANHVKQFSVGTECMDNSEYVSLGEMTECVQQTSVKTLAVSCQASVKTLPVSCQTEAIHARKLSDIVYPDVQRTAVPVTAAASTPVPESMLNANGNNAKLSNARTNGGTTYRRVIEVICCNVSKLKDLVRTIHRSNPSELHEIVVLFADILSKFCLQLTNPDGRDLNDIVKQFQNNMAKDFESKKLWTWALNSDAVICKDGKRSRSRHADSHSHQHGGTKRTTSYTKHYERHSSKLNRSSLKRSHDKESGSRDDESMAHLYKRSKESRESKDEPKYSSKSSSGSSKSEIRARQRFSTSTNKYDTKRQEETHHANREGRDRVDGKSDIRVITKSSDTESRKDTNTDAKKVGCYKSSKSSDPRLTKSGEDDIGIPRSLSSPSDIHTDLREIITGEFSNAASKQVDDNTPQSKCQSLNFSESEHASNAVSPSSNTKSGVSSLADSGSYTLTRKSMPKSQTTSPEPRNLSPVILEDGELPQQTNGRTSANVSDVKQYTFDETATVFTNVCKNFPYVEQPKMPSSKRAENCGHKGQSFRDITDANSDYIDEKNKDLPETSRKKSNPSEIDASVCLTLEAGVTPKKDCALKSSAEMKSPVRISSDPSSPVSITSGDSDRTVEAGDCDDVSISPVVNATGGSPVEEIRMTITQESQSGNIGIRPGENDVKSDVAKIGGVKNGIESGEIRKDSGQSFIPKEVPRKVKTHDRLQTFCIGPLSNWCSREKTLSEEGQKLEGTSGPESQTQARTSSPDTEKREGKPSEEGAKLQRTTCPTGENKKLETTSNGEIKMLETTSCSGGENKKLERTPCPSAESKNLVRTSIPGGESKKLGATLCPGGENKTLEKTPRPGGVNEKLKKKECPVRKKRVRKPSLEGKKRPQSSPKYSPILTPITHRRDEGRYEPYYHNEHSGNEAAIGRYSRYHPPRAPPTYSNWDSTETYCPSTFLSFGGATKSRPKYGGVYGQ